MAGGLKQLERVMRKDLGPRSIQEVSAEELAQLFHHYHQVLAPDFGSTSNSMPDSWSEVATAGEEPHGRGNPLGAVGIRFFC